MNDPRQAGNDEETKTFRSLIETATDDFDLNPFTETVEDAELDALLAGSNQTDGSLAGGETQGTVPPTDTAGNKGLMLYSRRCRNF